MESHELRVLGRVADEIASYRTGRLSIQQLLTNAYGLFTAADVRDLETRDQFLDLYYALSSADDARQPWMPVGLGSDRDVEVALTQLEAWAEAIRAKGGG